MSKDRHQPYCKPCSKFINYEFRKKNPDKIKAIDPHKYKKHKDKILECRKSYYQKHSEKIKKNKKSRDRNTPAQKKWKQEYYLRNKEIIRAKQKQWRSDNKLELKDRIMKKKYGIGVDQFTQMKLEQSNQCLICAMENKLVIDHCHKTGLVRGLLCETCNILLGHAKDDQHILNSAIQYLARFK
jgi:hypothetical protein